MGHHDARVTGQELLIDKNVLTALGGGFIRLRSTAWASLSSGTDLDLQGPLGPSVLLLKKLHKVGFLLEEPHKWPGCMEPRNLPDCPVEALCKSTLCILARTADTFCAACPTSRVDHID